MKSRQQMKISVDIFMTVALLFLMGYQFWGDIAHEWVGAGMFLMFILHHILNWKWHQNLLKGKYYGLRIFQLLVNLALFAAMVGMMISGILLSNYVFAFLPIHGGTAFARILHMSSVYWGFVLMALHLGLHWMIFLNIAKRHISEKSNASTYKIIINVMGLLIAIYGCFAFIKRDLLTYMFVRTQFVFLDFNEPVILFYFDYLAIMGFFIFIGHIASNKIRNIRERR